MFSVYLIILGSVCMGNRKSCWWCSCMSWNALCSGSCCTISKLVRGMFVWESCTWEN